MVVCSVDDIRAEITTRLTDLDLTYIITKAYNRVLRSTGEADDTNPDIQLAVEYTACVITLRKMKTTGELASVSTANSKRQDTPDKDIEYYQGMANAIIGKYQSIRSSTFSSPSFHAGFSSHHHGGHHGFN
jgi:hypothetical protein